MENVNIFIFSSIFYISWIFINNFFQNIYYYFIVLLFIGLFFLILYLRTKKYTILIITSIILFILWIFISNYYLWKVKENLNFINNFTKTSEIIIEIQEVKGIKELNIIYNWKILSINWQKPKNTINSEVILSEWFERLWK